MLFLHSLKGSGSVTLKGVLGISFDDIDNNAFGIDLLMDEDSPINRYNYNNIMNIMHV